MVKLYSVTPYSLSNSSNLEQYLKEDKANDKTIDKSKASSMLTSIQKKMRNINIFPCKVQFTLKIVRFSITIYEIHYVMLSAAINFVKMR